MRHYQKLTGLPVRLSDAAVLAQFSFPLEQKLKVIELSVEALRLAGKTLFSLNYLKEPFQIAESNYHKGRPPTKAGGLSRISDILAIEEG